MEGQIFILGCGQIKRPKP